MRSWLVWVVLVALVSIARADDVSDREEARRAFEAGQAADRQRDWQTAIDHYLRANDLVPHPNTLYNIATNYERLGKLREAARWYQQYLDNAPDTPDRDRVAKQLRDLQQRPGTITVRSIPNGARVQIDGRDVGVTPYSGHITGGAHRVEVDVDNMRGERQIKVEYGEPAIVDITLRGAAGTLRVVGTPAGALVTVDELPAGQVPLTLQLVPGIHRVRVTQYGYEVFATTANIEANREFVVEAQLTRALGTFGESKPPGPSKIGYLIGAGGGVDARGEGEVFLFEIGARTVSWDASVRIGKTIGFSAIDLMIRWTLLRTRITPFLAVGYTVVSDSDDSNDNGSGYMLTGGLRFDISRGERVSFSLVAESGLRAFQGVSSAEPGEARMEKSGYLVPVMTSLQIQYK